MKDAQAAISAYRQYYALLDKAYADPNRDWSKDVKLLTDEPIRSEILTDLDHVKKKKQVGAGRVVVEPVVTKVTGDVYLKSCVDSSQAQLLTDGKSHKLPDVKGSYWRHVSLVTVTKYTDGRWRVSAIDEQNWSVKC